MNDVCYKARETVLDILKGINVYVAVNPKEAEWGVHGYLSDLDFAANAMAIEKIDGNFWQASNELQCLEAIFAANDTWIQSERTEADDAEYDKAIEFVRNRINASRGIA